MVARRDDDTGGQAGHVPRHVHRCAAWLPDRPHQRAGAGPAWLHQPVHHDVRRRRLSHRLQRVLWRRAPHDGGEAPRGARAAVEGAMTITSPPPSPVPNAPAPIEPTATSASTRRLILANIWVAVLAFGVAALMAVMQAMSRAQVALPERTARMYYMSVTAHGVLMALVFTTFFIMGFGYAIIQREAGDIRWPRLSWIAFWVGVAGTVMTALTILLFKASVLYTFYPPLQAHPAFYIGLTLVVVSSWVFAANAIATWWRLRRANPSGVVSLAMHATTANAMLWLLCTLGVAAEMLFQLIPWSLGLTRTVDPLLARTLFWFTGHPLVYFWILPAYTVWYAVLPRATGGYLFSEPLGRMVFAYFLVISTPVGFHHQFQDPGISAGWKLVHTALTMT